MRGAESWEFYLVRERPHQATTLYRYYVVHQTGSDLARIPRKTTYLTPYPRGRPLFPGPEGLLGLHRAPSIRKKREAEGRRREAQMLGCEPAGHNLNGIMEGKDREDSSEACRNTCPLEPIPG